MKIAKKVLLITSLTTLALSCLLLILAIFGVQVFEGILFRLLLTLGTFAVGSGIALSELNVVEKRKILGFVSLGFLGLSVFLALISFCTPLFEVAIFNKILGVVAILSVLFAIIVSLNTKLEKKFMPLQIATYISLSLVVLELILLIVGISIFEIDGMLQIFLVLCVLSVGLLVATAVVGAKKRGDEKQSQTDNLTLKQQYANLKAENERLLQENLTLKNEIEKLKNTK